MPSKPKTFGPKRATVRAPDRRESASRRGYGSEWRRIRAWFLRRNPLCVHCLREQRTEPATEVDHIRPLNDGGTNDTANLQALCKSCHSRKTARDVEKRSQRGGIGGVNP